VRARIWGCRGSLAAPGPDTVRAGGNTSCVEVRTESGDMIILDAGTGLRALGLHVAAEEPRTINLLLTHLHLDHLEGLGFFGPLWDPKVEFHFWGPPSPMTSLRERIARYLSPPLFPVHISDVPSKPIFHDVPINEFQIGSARIMGAPISHSGPTVGYRITDSGRTLAYMPDHEPSRGGDLREMAPNWISGYALAHEADVLMHDSQYTEAEYPSRVGWGHSSIAHVVTYAQIAAVKSLLLFHHDPLHDDATLDAKLERARELWGDANGNMDLAREGLQFELR
jgi:phosphoribosyl 1,2-cyclic phosphodiesterase